MGDGNKKKIAILGGGCGGVAAAYWLTSDEERQKQFEVTVYTQGWRLGGKAASGRNEECFDRIEEHGLHMLMGFYKVAFETIRAAYDEQKGRPGLFPNWQEAFSPQQEITLWLEPREEGQTWEPYTIKFPPRRGKPGDSDRSESQDHWLPRLLELMYEHLEPQIRQVLSPIGKDDTMPSFSDAHRLARDLSNSGEVKDEFEGEIIRLIDQLPRQDLSVAGSKGRLLLHFAELGLAMALGYARDVFRRCEDDDFDCINHWDFSKWLRHHGASEEAAWSAPVRAIYDLAFAYRNGASTDPGNAAIAAGAALRLCWRMILDYRDAPLWRMNAGMGDVVFTPLYTLLRDRGVRFAFFHRVQDIRLSAGGAAVDSIGVSEQVKLKNGTYNPLRRVKGKEMEKGLDCWPNQPLWEQIEGGKKNIDLESPWETHEVARLTLRRGQDFDFVVLAIPPEAARPLTEKLADDNETWRLMLEKAASVPTHSVQLWLKPNVSFIDWKGKLVVSTAYVHPLESWADMSHLLPRETHGPGGPVSCQYLCGTVEPPKDIPPPGQEATGFQERENAKGHELTRRWTSQWVAKLWPSAASGSGLDWSKVDGCHDHVNIAPSERYVQTLPGSVKFRLAPGWDGISNLVLAGDWTITSINGGSAEAAFESGKAAAEAVVQRVNSSS